VDFRRAPNSSAPARLAIIRRIVIGKSHAKSGDRSFHTVMELRYGAMRAGWGELRQQRLERRIAELTVIPPDDEMITDCAIVRVTNRSGTHSATNSTTATGGSQPPSASACHSSLKPRHFDEAPGLELITAIADE
jgi:hypothetical protein